MGQNLTPARILFFKKKWEGEVSKRSTRAMIPSMNSSQASWTYVNFERLASLMRPVGASYSRQALAELVSRDVVDQNGIPIVSTGLRTVDGRREAKTLYQQINHIDGIHLIELYRGGVDSLVQAVSPVELGAIWTPARLREFIQPGMICYALRGFRFKCDRAQEGFETREVRAVAGGIEIRFFAYSQYMFGDSALYDAFCGNRTTAVLLHIKDVQAIDGRIVLTCTCIAMGMGFLQYEYSMASPHKLLYGWANRQGFLAIREQQLNVDDDE
jgi:hypothetical protein